MATRSRFGALALALGLAVFALAALAACDTSAGGLPPVGDVPDATGADTGADPLVPTTGAVFAGTATLRSKADEVLYAGYTAIAGDLVITAQDAAGITLDGLEQVTGSVRIVGALGKEASGNLSLPRLTRIGGNLVAVDTHSVGTLELPNLRTIGGHCDLSHGIFELRAGRLEEINGDLRVSDARLVGVELAALATIGGSLRAARYSAETTGGSLDLELPSLRAISGDLELSAGPPTYLKARRLAWLRGDLDLADTAVGVELPSLTSVTGDVRLERLDAFVFALDSLAEVGGDLLITDSGGAGLVSLALPSLAVVAGRCLLTGLNDTTAIRLDALIDLGRVLRVDANTHLSSVSAAQLTLVHSDLSVSDNGLPVLVDFPSLATVGGDLLLQRNSGVDARLGLLAAVTGDLRVGTTRLTRLAVPALVTVGRSVVVSDAASSEGVLAFPSLATVGGDLQVVRTAYVTTLLAPALTTIGAVTDGFPLGDLRLDDNQHLTTLGLTALTTVVGALFVQRNMALPADEIDAALGALPPGGARTICGNLEAPPCE